MIWNKIKQMWAVKTKKHATMKESKRTGNLANLYESLRIAESNLRSALKKELHIKAKLLLANTNTRDKRYAWNTIKRQIRYERMKNKLQNEGGNFREENLPQMGATHENT